MNNTKRKVLSGLMWKFGERISAQVVSFAVSVVLARMLPTEAYGLIALVMIFITFANCIVVNGFGSSLIQKKDADNLDFSSVLYFQIALSLILYVLLYFTAPLISSFFGEGYELLTPVLRVLGIRIPLTAINNVQHAYVGKKMIFKKFFFSTIIGTIISAFVGITMAYKGFGVWALVTQYLTNTIIDTIILAITIHWKPVLKLSTSRLKDMFRFGWKILIASIIGEAYMELRSVIIGKIYTSSDLAFFDKAKQIPNIIVTNINTTIANVMFPAISSAQNNPIEVKNMTRRAIKTTSYIMCPMMFGLAVIAEPLITLLLTEKWLPCVPYLQLFCISFCFEPVQTSNVQAIKAVGRSDIILKLEILKKGSSILILLCVMNHSVEAIAYSGLLTTLIAAIANTTPNKKLISYSFRELLADMAPGLLVSTAMAVSVFFIGQLVAYNTVLQLAVQVISGGIIYLVISVIFRVEAFTYLKDTLFELLKKKKSAN